MDNLAQYSTVKVVALTKPLDSYDGWGVNRRAPVVGDVATIVEILHGVAGEVAYVVECGRAEGTVEWLGDFAPREIVAHEAP